MKKIYVLIIIIIILIVLCFIPTKKTNKNIYMPKKITISMSKKTTSEKNFTWHTISNKAHSDIQIVEAKGKKNKKAFENKNVISSSGSIKGKILNLYVHKLKVKNLKKGTEYYYRVGDKKRNIWSKIGKFKTDDGDHDFSFIYVADQQSILGSSKYSIYTLQSAIKQNKSAEFLMNAGDLVNTTSNKKEWIDNLDFSVYGNIPAITTAGNHDYYFGDANIPNATANHFYYDGLDSQDTTTGIYYSLNYGNTHITVLNTNNNWFSDLDDQQLLWLEKDLESKEAKNADFNIVLMHRGMYTPGPHYYHYNDIQALTNQLTNIMAKYNVDLVLQGHDHVYALSYPIDENKNPQKINTELIYEYETNKHINAMKNKAPVYFIGGTAGTKYEPLLINQNENYLVDPNYRYEQKIPNDEVTNYYSKFQKMDSPMKNDGTKLSMFSNITVSKDKIIVDSYTVDNQNLGEVNLYNSFAIIK